MAGMTFTVIRFYASLVSLVFFAASAAVAETVQIDGRVVGVADGDTLTILDGGKRQHRIRIDGIDAPEKGQAFGNRARQSLAELAHERAAAAECHKVDRYERRVCKVFVGGFDVGLEQVKRGLAWHFKRYKHEQSDADRRTYSAAEMEARKTKVGLWRDAEPIPPWEWRQQHNGKRRLE